MAERYDAGIVTAYGAAVRGGYTGTYDEFCAQQAGYAQSAAAVEQAKQDAQTAAQRAQNVADSIPADYSQMSEDVSALKDDLTAAQVELAKKANTDGYYEEMTVGNAEQLVSTVTNADDTPYNFRTTAGSVDVGDRAYVDAIVGGTVVLNQLSAPIDNAVTQKGVTITPDNDGSVTVVGTTTESGALLAFKSFETIKNHKYFITAKGLTSGISVYTDIGGSISTSEIIRNETEDKSSASVTLRSDSNITYNAKIWVSTFDLTQMFGSTIADYIYSLETATAGAGVAWLKANAPKIFNGEYIPFNAGTLQSVVGLSEKRNTGLNQWDEVTELGRYDVVDGATFNDSTRIRCKNLIPVIGGATYYITKPATYLCYDADGNYTGQYLYLPEGGTFTVGSNVRYIKFYATSAYGTTYKNDICINLHWDGEKDGTYEPYTVHTYAFDPTVELRGVPKLKDGKLYFDGDRYLPDGTVTRRYGIVDLGTLPWVYTSQRFRAPLNDAAIPSTTNVPNAITTIYRFYTANIDFGGIDKGAAILIGGGNNLLVRDTSYTDVASFKTAMSGVMLVYELATPTTETAEPYQHVQICDDFGTEEFITTSLVPVGHETRYAPNLRAKLEMSPDSPDGDGLYIVQQSSGENTYIPLASSATIQNILERLTALEGNTNEG